MSQPPRAIESIIRSLGADPYLSDVVLGDLAEEFAERAAFDGEIEARRWYTAEAIRSVPHLLRSAFRQMRVGDVPRLIGVALFAWLGLIPISMMAYAIVAIAARLIGTDWFFRPPLLGPGFLALILATMPLAGVVGGYIAAWRNARAPLIGAFAFGAVFTCINLITGLFIPSPLGAPYRFAALAMFNVGAIVGGMIRTTRLEPSTGWRHLTP